MNKCLRIVFTADFPEGFLRSFIQKQAQRFNLEGIAQTTSEKEIRIVACGTKNEVDEFLDALHKGSSKCIPEDIQIEPFLNDKDYRGVFRVIE